MVNNIIWENFHQIALHQNHSSGQDSTHNYENNSMNFSILNYYNYDYFAMAAVDNLADKFEVWLHLRLIEAIEYYI